MKQSSQKRVRNRLARIEGQVRGLMLMIEEDRDSKEVLTQLSAIRAALDSVGTMVISDHVEEIAGATELDSVTKETLHHMIKNFLK